MTDILQRLYGVDNFFSLTMDFCSRPEMMTSPPNALLISLIAKLESEIPSRNKFQTNHVNIRSAGNPSEFPWSNRQAAKLMEPLDKIGGGVVLREVKEDGQAKILNSSLNRTNSSNNQNQHLPYKLILRRNKHRLQNVVKNAQAGFLASTNRKLIELNKGKRNFDEIDRAGFKSMGKRNFDEIDRVGFRNMGKKYFDEINRVGFQSIRKRDFNEPNRPTLNTMGKKNIYEIDRVGFQTISKRNFDEIDRVGFRNMKKRNFVKINHTGSLGKRNFDEMDNAGLRDIEKMNFGEIDRAELNKEAKRTIDEFSFFDSNPEGGNAEE